MEIKLFSPVLLIILAFVYGALAVGSIIRFVALQQADHNLRKKRLDSLRTWWILSLIVGVALLVGQPGVCLLMALVSGAAFREYSKMVGSNPMDKRANSVVYLVLCINYLLLLVGKDRAFVIFIPLLLLLLPAVLQLLQGRTEGYMRSTAGLYWGSMLLIYALSHTVLLFILPETSKGPAGGAGWFIYLILLTETNDIAQALIGRRVGAHYTHRIAPMVSPNKTWVGFIGGLFVTVFLAIILAPWMTTLTSMHISVGLATVPAWATPLIAGVLISLAGFFGDINMSAIKRDSGVKDSSALLPGMGGLIDRIDSLTFTAPVFIYFIYMLSA